MSRRPAVRNEGGLALERLGRSQKSIAAEVGVSAVMVTQWKNGERSPGSDNRKKLFDLYSIPIESWDSPLARKPPSPIPGVDTSPQMPRGRPHVPASAAATETAGTAFAMAKALQAQAQSQLDDLLDGNAWSPGERALVMQRLASTINVLAKLTGQYEIGRRMLELPVWKALETELFEALRPFPDASACVAERLERFEAIWFGDQK